MDYNINNTSPHSFVRRNTQLQYEDIPKTSFHFIPDLDFFSSNDTNDLGIGEIESSIINDLSFIDEEFENEAMANDFQEATSVVKSHAKSDVATSSDDIIKFSTKGANNLMFILNRTLSSVIYPYVTTYYKDAIPTAYDLLELSDMRIACYNESFVPIRAYGNEIGMNVMTKYNAFHKVEGKVDGVPVYILTYNDGQQFALRFSKNKVDIMAAISNYTYLEQSCGSLYGNKTGSVTLENKDVPVFHFSNAKESDGFIAHYGLSKYKWKHKVSVDLEVKEDGYAYDSDANAYFYTSQPVGIHEYEVDNAVNKVMYLRNRVDKVSPNSESEINLSLRQAPWRPYCNTAHAKGKKKTMRKAKFYKIIRDCTIKGKLVQLKFDAKITKYNIDYECLRRVMFALGYTCRKGVWKIPHFFRLENFCPRARWRLSECMCTKFYYPLKFYADLSKITRMKEPYKKYKVPVGNAVIRDFIAEHTSNWSRPRHSSSSESDDVSYESPFEICEGYDEDIAMDDGDEKPPDIEEKG